MPRDSATADAITRVFESPNVADSNSEVANIVDVVDDLARSARRIADAIRPGNSSPGNDATGGTVDSLTEAVMGITAGLCQVASAIEALAQAVRRD